MQSPHANEFSDAAALRAVHSGVPAAELLVVDDHPGYRCGLAAILGANGRQVHEAGGVADGVRALQRYPAIGLILYDWGLPVTGGRAGLRELRQVAPHTPLVVMTGGDEEAIAEAARNGGADGFFGKSAEATAIRMLLRRWLDSPSCSIENERRLSAGVDEPPQGAERSHGLTTRQLAVLRLLGHGCANKRIGTLLRISDLTVRDHVSDILRLLGLRNRTQAAMKAAEWGLITPDSCGWLALPPLSSHDGVGQPVPSSPSHHA